MWFPQVTRRNLHASQSKLRQASVLRVTVELFNLILVSFDAVPKNVTKGKVLKSKTEIVENVVWHDVLNKSICRHKSINLRPLSVLDLINSLKTPQDKLSAIV